MYLQILWKTSKVCSYQLHSVVPQGTDSGTVEVLFTKPDDQNILKNSSGDEHCQHIIHYKKIWTNYVTGLILGSWYLMFKCKVQHFNPNSDDQFRYTMLDKVALSVVQKVKVLGDTLE